MELFNRAAQRSSSVGSGPVVLEAPLEPGAILSQPGWQSFAAAGAQPGATIRYLIFDGPNWEYGPGIFNPPELFRASGAMNGSVVGQKSSTGNLLNLSGTEVAFVSAAAEDLAGSYGDEQAQDAAAALIKNGPGITWTYDDAANTLTPTVSVSWTEITDKPATFPPSPHTHPISDVTGLATELDNRVAVAGDTMTGTLTISAANAVLALNKAGSALNNLLVGNSANVSRWAIVLGNEDLESGSNAGSNLDIRRYGDSGGPAIGTPLSISRATGLATVGGDPTAPLGIATKQYVDAGDVVSWGEITGIPATFPPSSHFHPITDVTGLQGALDLKAPLASPALTGNPTAPTAILGDNDTTIATTAFVTAAVSAAGGALPSDALPLINGTAAPGTSALYARGDHIHPVDTSRAAVIHTHPQSDITNLTADLALKAPLASPTFTGTPTVPTAGAGTATTQAASTAFVGAAITAAAVPPPATVNPLMDGAVAVGTTTKYAREDHRHPVDTSREPTIAAGTAAMYWRGDKTFQTLNKAAVGLDQVDNTSDANKPVSTAQTAAFVNVSGDTMSGDLTITKTNPYFILNKAAIIGSETVIISRRNDLNRWAVHLGDLNAESTGNVGSDFQIARYNDAGALLNIPLGINRATGKATLSDDAAISGTTASTSSTTGALTVAGGVGIAGALNVGGTVTLKGTATNDAAASGNIGEHIASLVDIGSEIAITSGAALTITSINLTAGDWDVSAMLSFFAQTSATSVTRMQGSIHTTASLFTSVGRWACRNLGSGATNLHNAREQLAIPPYRFSLVGPGTIFLVAESSFSGGTMVVGGYVRARRMR